MLAYPLDIPPLPDAPSRASVRSEFGLPPHAWVLGSVGHLRAEKNLPRLVRACSLLRHLEDLVLVVVGDGPERQGIEAEVKSQGLEDRVVMLGHRQDARRLYGAFG